MRCADIACAFNLLYLTIPTGVACWLNLNIILGCAINEMKLFAFRSQ